jgi:hypothetical protein
MILIIIGALVLLFVSNLSSVQAQTDDDRVSGFVWLTKNVCRTVHSGPSLILTLTPGLMVVSGVGLAWILIKRRINKI